MTSPTQRSLELLKKEGYCVQVVERYNAFARVRVDLFGFIDIVAINPGCKGVIGVQTTSSSNLSARVKKILGIPQAKLWVEAGNRIVVHGWGKKGKTKRKLWEVTSREICLENFMKG